MRIAVTGTHGTGKTTLVEDFVSAHRIYEAVAEPYWQLAQRGVPLSDEPNIADLEEQLALSCNLILDEITAANVVYDRCPLDFLAYLEVISDAEGYEWLPQGRLLSRIGKALARLDLVVFVPLLHDDEIAEPIDCPKLRRDVDRTLKKILRDDDLGLFQDGPPILEVSGSRTHRLAKVEHAPQSTRR